MSPQPRQTAPTKADPLPGPTQEKGSADCFSPPLGYSPGAAVTKDLRLGVFKQEIYSLTGEEPRSLKSSCRQGWAPSGGSGWGASFLPLPASGVAGHALCFLASLLSLPCHHMAILSGCLSVPSPLKRTPVKRMDTKGGKLGSEGMNWEIGIDIYTLIRIK